MRLPGESTDGNPVKFQIISVRVVEKDEAENKHVEYTVRVQHMSGKEDLNVVTIERRYTHFADLYNSLKDAFPDVMGCVSFPKKVRLYS